MPKHFPPTLCAIGATLLFPLAGLAASAAPDPSALHASASPAAPLATAAAPASSTPGRVGEEEPVPSPAPSVPDDPAGGATGAGASAATEATPTFTDEVTVASPVPGYAATHAVAATKSSTPLAETPQAVTVVTGERLRDLGASGVQDALNYAAGVRSDAYGLDSRTDSVSVRGASPDEYLDGLRQSFNYYTSTTRTDPYLLERIEVLRGPASVLYGQGSTAGIVNLVSKRPQAAASRELVVQGGSFDRRQVQADFTGPLDDAGRWLYRVVALERDADTQVDSVRDDRSLFASALTFRPNERTRLTIDLRWQRDRSGSTLQFFPWSGSGAPNPNGPIPTASFLGEPGFDRYDSERASAGWHLERRLGADWTLHHQLRFVRNEVDYRSLYADAFGAPGDSFLDAEQRVVGRYLWIDQPKVDMWSADQHAEGRFTTGAIRHQVTVGVDAVHFGQRGRGAFDFPAHLGGGVAPIDVYAPVPTGLVVPALADRPQSTQEQLGLYVQDQIKLGERWIVVAGARHDRAESGLEGAADELTSATTHRLGVLYQAAGGLSPYASWSESFTPVPGTNLAGRRFAPLRGEQLEVGLRLQPPGAAWSIGLAAFAAKERNRLIADPANPLDQIQAGRTETSGVELEVQGALGAGFEVTGHYNHLAQDPALEAQPAHQAAVWLRRGVALGRAGHLTAGVGARWFSAFRDGGAPTVPALALYDALLAWDFAPLRLALNVANLEDERYVATCLGRGDCFYGARRTATLSLGYQF